MSSIREAPLFDFIDDESRNSAERQIQLAHQRLSRCLHGHVPPVKQLAAAMPELMDAEDARRAAQVSDLTPISIEHSKLQDMCNFLELSNLAYLAHAKLLEGVGALGYSVPLQREKSSKYAPAFFCCTRESPVSELCLVIRGTMEPADVLTDIAVETKEILGMRGHGGIVGSARHLHEEVTAQFAELVRKVKPERIVVTGHSLGAAAATALTMLWRAGEKGTASESDASLLRNVECFAFCPVPIVSDVQVATKAEGITAIVNGMDVFPRLSVPSLDRLFLRLATSELAQSGISAFRRNMLSAVAGALESGMRMAGRQNTKPVPNEIANEIKDNIKEKADHGKVAASVTVLSKLAGTDLDAEIAGDEAEKVEQMYVVGEILHLEHLFAKHGRRKVHKGMCPFGFREKHAAELTDIEVSNSMVNDHFSNALQTKFKELLRFSSESAPVTVAPQKVLHPHPHKMRHHHSSRR